MIKEYIGEGKDLLEATAAAKEGLILQNNIKNEDDIKVEVICDFKKKTLGLFGGSMAKVKAFIELPDPKPEKKKAEKKPAAAKAESKPEKKAEPKAKAEKKAEPKAEPENVLNLIPADQLKEGSSAAKAAAYIKTVMEGLGCENVSVSAAETDGVIFLQLDGEKLGVVY